MFSLRSYAWTERRVKREGSLKKEPITPNPEPGSPDPFENPAGIFPWNHRALNESFQKEFGRSIGKALTRARIQHISHLLMDTDLQVQEVAAAVGYDDVRHFSRYFKHSTGMTPRAYRRRMLVP
jgi:transcriptional regulator GlxA family with amidase domain